MSYPSKGGSLPKPFKAPDAYTDPKHLTCVVYNCPFKDTEQTVVGAYDQPYHFVDASRVFLLACGHEAF